MKPERTPLKRETNVITDSGIKFATSFTGVFCEQPTEISHFKLKFIFLSFRNNSKIMYFKPKRFKINMSTTVVD